MTGSRRLSHRSQQFILDADEAHVSVVSLWEIAIKRTLGKGDMPVALAQALQAFRDAGYGLLAVKSKHAIRVEDLPAIHSDLFDRMLMAQARFDPMTLVTSTVWWVSTAQASCWFDRRSPMRLCGNRRLLARPAD